MAAQTLFNKLWQSHLVHEESDGIALVYIDRHLIHEVTSPQAFEGLAIGGRKPWRIGSVIATADHNVPTHDRANGISDAIARLQVETLDRNVEKFAVPVEAWRSVRPRGVHVR
jgi:3-isopropylmalate/(R)-2-methylmalate dehydratase large subunit